MTKVNPNNGNEIKSDIFSWDIIKSDIIFHWFQLAQKKFETKKGTQKKIETKRKMCKSDSILPYLQSSTLSK